MNDWEKYYRDKEIRSFRAQSPYYEYVLESFGPDLEDRLGKHEVVNLALGGIDPTVTQPEDFLSLGHRAITAHPKSFFIIDQNPQAIASLGGTACQPILAQLENLPHHLPPLHPLICDYTLDFMSDRQVSVLNETLPSRLHSDGLVMVTIDDSVLSGLTRLVSHFKRGVELYPRNRKKLAKLLSNFKPVCVASTGNHNLLIVLTRKDNPMPPHRGPEIGLYQDEGIFGDWLKERSH